MNARPLLLALGALALGIVAAPAAPQPPLLLAAMALCLVAGVLLARHPAGMVGALLAALPLFGAGRARLAMTVAPDDVSRHIGGPSVWVLGTLASDTERKPGRRQLMLSQSAPSTTTPRPARWASSRSRCATGAARGRPAPRGWRTATKVWLRGRVERPRGDQPRRLRLPVVPGAARRLRRLDHARRAADVRATGRASGTPSAARRHGSGRGAGGLRPHPRPRMPPCSTACCCPSAARSSRRGGRLFPHRHGPRPVHVRPAPAVLAAFLGWLSTLPLPRRWANLAVVCVIWMYALAAGLGRRSPAPRSITVLLAAPLARRDADPLNSLLLAAFLILLHSPWRSTTPGRACPFSRSPHCSPGRHRWSACFSLGTGDGVGARMARGLIGRLAVGVVAQAGSWPLVAWHFNLFSLVAPLANLPVAFWSGILLLAGLAAVALAWARPGRSPLRPADRPRPVGAAPFGAPFAALPWAAVSVASPPVALIALYYALLWGGRLAHEHTRRKTLFAPGPAPAAPWRRVDGGRACVPTMTRGRCA